MVVAKVNIIDHLTTMWRFVFMTKAIESSNACSFTTKIRTKWLGKALNKTEYWPRSSFSPLKHMLQCFFTWADPFGYQSLHSIFTPILHGVPHWLTNASQKEVPHWHPSGSQEMISHWHHNISQRRCLIDTPVAARQPGDDLVFTDITISAKRRCLIDWPMPARGRSLTDTPTSAKEGNSYIDTKITRTEIIFAW